MSNTPRLLFYFLHLLGVGHVFRAKRLIEGFADQGIAVDVIYGGDPVPDVTFEAESVHYLSPIRAGDNAYSYYLDADGNRLGKAFQEQRSREIIAIFKTLDPDVILTEAFPFGRRMVRHEMRTLFDAAASRSNPPLIVSSVRDILQERKKPGRVEETLAWIENDFDHVLVHSDPSIIDLSSTYPMAHQIENKLTYTGFVIPPVRPEFNASVYDVIVSAGGGAFGVDLMETALAAAMQWHDLKWCLTTGPNLSNQARDALTKNRPPNVKIVTYLDNLSAHMKSAKVTVSQCGYNTAMDVLAAHRDSACRAVFVPYDTEGQTEQLRRSELLAKAGYAISLPQSQLTEHTLLAALKQAEALPQISDSIDFSGVANSAKIIRSWMDAR